MSFSKPVDEQAPRNPGALKWLYVVNGAIATLAHYVALRSLLWTINGLDAGIANMGASLVGVTVSFLGNRIIVFRHTRQPAGLQFVQYVVLYGVLALLQGLLMHALVNGMGVSLLLGFFFCAAFQWFAGYVANKHLIFCK